MGSNRKKKSVSLFNNDLEAVFVRRPNRFLIIAKAGKKEIPCHCPNPGRMTELLAPGAKLFLEKRDSPAKTEYTAAALCYRGSIVPLISARANKAAEALILEKIIPGIKEIHAEWSMGNSRFDFLCIDRQGRRHLVEVKACSLVENDVAMFPDAPSARALKHLEELNELGANEYICHVLFVIVHSSPKVFVPNLHTDPAFAAALSRYAKTNGGAVNVHTALIRCEADGSTTLVKASVPLDLSHGNLAERNSGSYLVVLELAKAAKTAVGSLGTLAFKKGWYVYTGSAMKNLDQRVSRHLRKIRKAKHWHIDYLTPHAENISAFPIRSYNNLECDLAAVLQVIGGRRIPRFGCTDCKCESHLFYFKANPARNRDFIEMLLRFRHIESLKKQSPR